MVGRNLFFSYINLFNLSLSPLNALVVGLSERYFVEICFLNSLSSNLILVSSLPATEVYLSQLSAVSYSLKEELFCD